jgi:hypothetical protein
MTGSGNFECPACQCRVQLKTGYFRLLYCLAAVMVWLIGRAVGIRSDALLWTVLVLLWPAFFVIASITLWLFPPDVELSGDYRGILYPQAPAETAASLGDTEDVSTGRLDRAEAAPRTRMFAGAGGTRPIEEKVFATLGIILLVFGVWMAIQPLVNRIAPELGATFTGPKTFPVTIHIGEHDLGVTNSSTGQWTCRIELGTWVVFTSTLTVESNQTRHAPYAAFERVSDRALDPLSAARESIWINCAEESGITHSWHAQ